MEQHGRGVYHRSRGASRRNRLAPRGVISIGFPVHRPPWSPTSRVPGSRPARRTPRSPPPRWLHLPAPRRPPSRPRALQKLLDRRRSNAPDLDRVATWLGTDRPLLLRGELQGPGGPPRFLDLRLRELHARLPGLQGADGALRRRALPGHRHPQRKVRRREGGLRHRRGHGPRTGIDYPVGTDSDFVVWEQYAVHAWPTSVLIDAQGQVRGRLQGRAGSGAAPALRPGGARRRTEEGVRRQRARGVPPSSAGGHRSRWPSPARCWRSPTAGWPSPTADTTASSSSTAPADCAAWSGSGLEGFSDGPAETASFRRPQGLAEREGQLYVADTENHAVRAGGPRAPVGWRPSPATAREGHRALSAAADARTVALRSPWDVAFLGDALWVAMAGSHQLWRLDVAHRRADSPAPGTGKRASSTDRSPPRSFAQPSGLASDGQAALRRRQRGQRHPGGRPRCGHRCGRWSVTGCSSSVTGTGRAASARLQHPLGPLARRAAASTSPTPSTGASAASRSTTAR